MPLNKGTKPNHQILFPLKAGKIVKAGGGVINFVSKRGDEIKINY